MDKKNNNFSVDDLTRLRKLIVAVVKVLEESINDFSKNNTISENNKDFIDFLFGKKCDIVSIITKLTNTLIKVIPIEEKILTLENNDKEQEKLSDDDIEMIRRYIKKCNFWFNKNNNNRSPT